MALQKQSTSEEDADAIATTTKTLTNTSVTIVTIIPSIAAADATDPATLLHNGAQAHQTVSTQAKQSSSHHVLIKRVAKYQNEAKTLWPIRSKTCSVAKVSLEAFSNDSLVTFSATVVQRRDVDTPLHIFPHCFLVPFCLPCHFPFCLPTHIPHFAL
jgi:hypothetical protein